MYMNSKYSIIIIALLTAPIMDAATAGNTIVQKITLLYAHLFSPGTYLFDKSIISTQNKDIDTWNATMNEAKNFVLENSKNLVGVKDSDLTGAMAKVEKASIDLMNALKISRGSTKGQDAIFSRIEKEMRSLGDSIKNKSFTLANKKDAQWVVETAAIYLSSGANVAYKNVINPPAPKDLPPTLPK